MEEIRARIREIRFKVSMSQGEFSSKMGINQKTWSNIENGVNPCSDRYVNLVCLTFNVRKEWFLHGRGEMFKPAAQTPNLVLNESGKPMSPEMTELIGIFQELVPLNQKAVVNFAETTLQSQRNTIMAMNESEQEKREQSV